MIRLQKAIAETGYTSRRKAEELITSGHVFVNGKKVTELGYKVAESAKIVIDGIELQKEALEYYLINKPREYICSLKDEKDRHIVTDLIDTNARIFPVGRLDYDTTGLLLLTNDGEFANILSHPSHRVLKTYYVKLNKILSIDHLYKIKNGVKIEDYFVKPVNIKLKKKDKTKNVCLVEISIIEGKNHIIKKLFANFHYDVLKLKREKYGIFELNGLQSGEYRKLTKEEINKIYELKK